MEVIKLLIKDLYNLGDLKTNNLTLKKYALELFPQLKNKYLGFNSYVGIEIEVEECNGLDEENPLKYLSDFWEVKTDGSLRPQGEGREYVSVPLRGLNITAALKIIEHLLTKVIPKSNFSHRCGIHVHVNCRNFTQEQVNNIIYTYTCLESLLFDQFVKDDRSGNSFCPPIVDAFISGNFGKYKYQALNRVTLQTLGTLEFRHLQGTKNIASIEKWIKYITNLVNYATSKTEVEMYKIVKDLNTLSTYNEFVKESLVSNEFVRLQESMERDVYVAKHILGRNFC